MTRDITPDHQVPEEVSGTVLDQICREGAQKLLAMAIEGEVQAQVDQHQERDDYGHRLVTRHRRLPQRTIDTGVGPIKIHQPRVYDRREGRRFTSAILPAYLRRSPTIDALIPALYLRGVSTNDFPEALEAILGPGAKGLSATNITRLKEVREKCYPCLRTVCHLSLRSKQAASPGGSSRAAPSINVGSQ